MSVTSATMSLPLSALAVAESKSHPTSLLSVLEAIAAPFSLFDAEAVANAERDSHDRVPLVGFIFLERLHAVEGRAV